MQPCPDTYRFAILPWPVAADPRLTKSDLRVLIALLSYRNQDTGPFWATREQIAVRCRLRVAHVTRATTHLESLGWLVKHHRRRQAVRYAFQVPIECIERHDGGATIVRTLAGDNLY